MTEETAKSERRAEIENAALDVMRERGFANMSMLLIAKKSKASNETLYRWYGDKHGLVIQLAKRVIDALVEQITATLRSAPQDPRSALATVAPALVRASLGSALAELDRAAAADRTGRLGAVIISRGRQTLLPLIEDIIQQGCNDGIFEVPSTREAAQWFLWIIVGDLRTRQIFNQNIVLTEQQIVERCDAAMTGFIRLVGRPKPV